MHCRSHRGDHVLARVLLPPVRSRIVIVPRRRRRWWLLREEQWREILFVDDVQFGAGADQRFDDLHLTCLHGLMQQVRAVGGFRVGIRTRRQQRLDGIERLAVRFLAERWWTKAIESGTRVE